MVQRIDRDPEPGPIDLDERLGEAIEAYLERAEGGHPPDPEAFASGYPELGGDLVAALEGLALVNGLVGGSGSSGPGHRLEEGRRVAGYRIVRELGRGGMGIVYEAVHVGLDRPVALKVLGGQAAPDSSGRRRFLNEAKTAAGLHHTHIVPVFDVGQVGGLCYYAMQRIEGSGLDRVLRHLRRDRTVAAGTSQGSASNRPGRATPATPPRPGAAGAAPGLGDETRSWAGNGAGGPWRRGEEVDEPPPFAPPRGSAYYRWVADVGRQAAEALGHAHKCGVIHRDIKPSNLLVDARGTIWVADFGLARRLADPSQTQFDSLLGTPRYMSPEQARTGAIDGRADVYSLGATLYELITLRPPFDGQSAAELIVQIAEQEPPRPRRFDPRVPLDLETILLKALGKRPADRYATAEELAEDLARFLAHEPVRARRIGPAGRLWRFARRHPSITAVTTAASTIVLTTATLAYVSVVRERDEAIHARAAEKNAMARTEGALRDAQSARLAELDKHADAVLLSDAANRRTRGLDLLARASALSPGPAVLVGLRDKAVAFLSVRDVEARPPIAAVAPRGLAFGPNGRRIAAIRDDNELGVWGVDAGDLVETATLPTPPGRARGGNPAQAKGGWRGWSPPRIATAGPQVAVVRPDGGGLRLFDVSNPTSPADDLPLKGHEIIALVATPDGRTLATLDRPAREARAPGRGEPGPGRAEPEEIRVSLWDRDHAEVPRATLILPPPKADPARPEGPPRGRFALPLLAIAPDGSAVAVARPNETEVALWDGDGEPLDPPTIDARVNISALALGPAGLLAVAGGAEIVVWDLAGPKPLPGLGRRQGYVTQLRFSPRDGSLLAAAVAPAGGVELWDLAAHDLVAALPTRDPVEDLAFAPDGRTLAATQASSIATWSIVEPVAQFQLPETGERPISLAFGPGDRLAIASRENMAAGALRLWGGPGRCPPEVQTWAGVKPGAVAFDGRGRLVTLDPRGLRWFEPPDPSPVASVELPDPPRGRGPSNPAPPAPPPGGAAPPLPPGRILTRSLARSRDGSTLAFLRTRDEGRFPSTPHRAGDVLIWRAGEPTTPSRLDLPGNHEVPAQGPGPLGNLVALAPDGSRLYHCGPAGDQLHAFDLRAAAGSPPRLEWTARVRDATCLAISPDGKTLALGGRPGDLALIDTADGAVRRPATPADDAGNRAESIAFSPDGLTLAVGGRDQVRLWALGAPARPLVRLSGHRGNLLALAFDSKGARLAAADERTVKVWDLRRLRDELISFRLGW